jgi:hypothetical protein
MPKSDLHFDGSALIKTYCGEGSAVCYGFESPLCQICRPSSRLLAQPREEMRRCRRCQSFFTISVSRILIALGCQGIADALPTTNPETLAAHVAVLAQFALVAPDAFQSRSDAIMAFLLKKVLMVSTPPEPVYTALSVAFLARVAHHNPGLHGSGRGLVLRGPDSAITSCTNTLHQGLPESVYGQCHSGRGHGYIQARSEDAKCNIGP